MFEIDLGDGSEVPQLLVFQQEMLARLELIKYLSRYSDDMILETLKMILEQPEEIRQQANEHLPIQEHDRFYARIPEMKQFLEDELSRRRRKESK